MNNIEEQENVCLAHRKEYITIIIAMTFLFILPIFLLFLFYQNSHVYYNNFDLRTYRILEIGITRIYIGPRQYPEWFFIAWLSWGAFHFYQKFVPYIQKDRCVLRLNNNNLCYKNVVQIPMSSIESFGILEERAYKNIFFVKSGGKFIIKDIYNFREEKDVFLKSLENKLGKTPEFLSYKDK